MPDLSVFLVKIPDDLKPITALGIGALMLVFVVMFHGAGPPISLAAKVARATSPSSAAQLFNRNVVIRLVRLILCSHCILPR